jgi:hypothetical protein
MRRSITLACIAAIGLCAFVPIQLLDNDAAWFAFAGAGVIVTLILVTYSIAWRSRIGFAIAAISVAAACILLTSDTTSLRERVRWIADAGPYKADVLASHPPSRRQLPHALAQHGAGAAWIRPCIWSSIPQIHCLPHRNAKRRAGLPSFRVRYTASSAWSQTGTPSASIHPKIGTTATPSRPCHSER